MTATNEVSEAFNVHQFIQYSLIEQQKHIKLKHARIPSLHWCFYIIPQFDNFRHFRQGGGKMAVLSVLYFKNRQFWSGLIHFMNELIAHHTRQQTPLLCLVLSCFHWCVCLVTESFNWQTKTNKSTQSLNFNINISLVTEFAELLASCLNSFNFGIFNKFIFDNFLNISSNRAFSLSNIIKSTSIKNHSMNPIDE